MAALYGRRNSGSNSPHMGPVQGQIKMPNPPFSSGPPTPSSPSYIPYPGVPDSPRSGHRRSPSNLSRKSFTLAGDMRHKNNTIYENPHQAESFGPRTSSSNQHRPRDLETPSPDRFLTSEDADYDQPLFSPGLNKSFTTHQAFPITPQMGVIASGESPRSSRASSHFNGRDSPASGHSSSDSDSLRKAPAHNQQNSTNSPYGQHIRTSASPASSQEVMPTTTGHLAAPGLNHRPSSIYSLRSERGRTDQPGYLNSPRAHTRGVSAHSYDSRLSSLTNLPHLEPPPPQLTGNAHIKQVLGNGASLVPSIKTLELYRANAKKSGDPRLQYELAVHMVTAAQQAEILASEGGRAPNRDLDSPHVDNSAAHSKAELLREAKQILERIANRLPTAQYYLADAYSSGIFNNGKEEHEKAFPLFVAASKHGHAEAGYRAGLCYEFGWGCRSDPEKAYQFYRQSASRSHPGAMLRLARACLRDDLGLRGRYKEGVKWLKRANDFADPQYPHAPYELGLLHETGYGDEIFQDLDYTAQLFTKAAELGQVDAMFRLGDAYEHGKLNCPRDANLSVHFYTGAAEKGHAEAMLALCAWYMVGAEPLIEKNEDEAYQWALKAAELGLPKAMFAVGFFTENGTGCRRDHLEANVWYVKAADAGYPNAIKKLQAMNAATSVGVEPKKGAKKPKEKDNKEAGKEKNGKLEKRRNSEEKKECVIM